MKQISVKYSGECRKCGATLEVGATAIYEHHIGLFCLTCEPKDTEEIRAYRQEAGDRRADKYDEWAQKRTDKAMTTLNHNRTYTDDIAFNTQPGHIPLRARVIKQNDRAYENLETARRFEGKANSLRKVRVKGDAEDKHQTARNYVLSKIRVGMEVEAGVYGKGIVKKINKKTAIIGNTGTSQGYTVKVDLSYIRPIISG